VTTPSQATLVRLVSHQQCSIDWFHTRRASERSHQPVVNAALVVSVDARQVADGITNHELIHAYHAPSPHTASTSHCTLQYNSQYKTVASYLLNKNSIDYNDGLHKLFKQMHNSHNLYQQQKSTYRSTAYWHWQIFKVSIFIEINKLLGQV